MSKEFPLRDQYGNPRTPWAVLCSTHGMIYLTKEQYNYQMDRPDSFWFCPIEMCTVAWDDDNYEDWNEQEEHEAKEDH